MVTTKFYGFTRNSWLKVKEVAALLEISPVTACRYLHQLCVEGVIEKVTTDCITSLELLRVE